MKWMNFLFPLFAAILQAGSFTLDKAVLSFKRVSYRTYLGMGFPLYFLAVLLFFLWFRPPLGIELLAGAYLWLMLASIGLSIAGNLLYYRALDGDGLGEIETLTLLQSIPAILLASLIFAGERDPVLVGAALAASAAVFWSHWDGRRFKVHKRTLPFLFGGLVIAPLSLIIIKELLTLWHPVSLELARSGAVALVMGSLFLRARSGSRTPPKVFLLLIITNALSAAGWILFYFGVQRLGVVHATLLFSVTPLLVYFASVFFLAERFKWKKAAAFGVVLLAVIAAQMRV
jgi:drug/metabolite transporter (DMT)-like permease